MELGTVRLWRYSCSRGICIDFKPLEIHSSPKWPWNSMVEDCITHPLTQRCRCPRCQRNKSFCSSQQFRKTNGCFFMHAHSLIAPVKPYSDVTLDLTSLVLGEMPLDELPTQVDELIHHMTQLMEQIHLVFLLNQPRKDLVRIWDASYCRIYVEGINDTLLGVHLNSIVLLFIFK